MFYNSDIQFFFVAYNILFVQIFFYQKIVSFIHHNKIFKVAHLPLFKKGNDIMSFKEHLESDATNINKQIMFNIIFDLSKFIFQVQLGISEKRNLSSISHGPPLIHSNIDDARDSFSRQNKRRHDCHIFSTCFIWLQDRHITLFDNIGRFGKKMCPRTEMPKSSKSSRY